MSRFLLVILMLAATAGAVVAYGDPKRIARASDTVSGLVRSRTASPARAAEIPRGQSGEFALRRYFADRAAGREDHHFMELTRPLKPSEPVAE